MKKVVFFALSLLGSPALATQFGDSLGIRCPVLFDGRVPKSMTPPDFDKNSSIFDHQFVHGQNQTWAEIIKFTGVPESLFDIPKNAKPVEVTISNQSIFLPGGDPPMPQFGFRRSELIPATNNGTDITVQGTTLSIGHSTSEITFLTGKPFNQSFDPTVHDPKTLRLAGRQSNSPETTFFQTPFDFDIWHNFAVTLGWTTNKLTVYYSKGFAPLKRVAGPTFNDNSGGGQFHAGVFKLPTGPLGIDVNHQGFQEAPIDEGLIFGGIFIEDSSKGCVTTFPA
ncbi:hypothetical protein CPB84DRAFT_1791812 [Gymnopilus junonius]|uniref:Glycoside hydrolase 131 catalytic N-terminal domain-containing protein n=1 Tax=Gymnopilus junonius TaxID=109634 RepID=A0A9P5NEX1_GYMJU|nr:hypothetical protein CPB84DRAFT_1791812 [Gymnopilus junonius]